MCSSDLKVESIDPTTRVIRFMPGGDPQRGWPCWWYLRVDGVAKDERVTLSLAGSDRPTRNNGQDTGKPLAAITLVGSAATLKPREKKFSQLLLKHVDAWANRSVQPREPI